MNTPCKPEFYYIKVGCKGVFVTRTCFCDVIFTLCFRRDLQLDDRVGAAGKRENITITCICNIFYDCKIDNFQMEIMVLSQFCSKYRS